MNYSEIKYCDIANGEGVRTSLFVSGCRHHCAECFNPETWSFTNGEQFTWKAADKIVNSMDHTYVDGLTVLGGEPMEPENQEALAPFLERVKRRYPDKTIWCYTGDVYEDLINPDYSRHTEFTDRMLACIDILVDGPFLALEHDITLRFRGSANQRIIDIPATRAANRVCLWEDDPQYTTHSMPKRDTLVDSDE